MIPTTIESKHKAIKKRLLKGYSISGAQAWYKYGVYRLSSIIHRLRKKEKMNVKTRMSSDGYAIYYIDFEDLLKDISVK